MREERGQLKGNQVIGEPYTLWGSVAGDVTVVRGSKFYMRGTVYGDLTILHGGRVHVFGNVTGGMIVKEGAKVILSGVIGKDCINEGGRLTLDGAAHVMGKLIRSEDGETQVDPGAVIDG